MIALIYILIGLTYTLINGLVRKLDTDGDYLLPMVWIFLWPICFVALIFLKFNHYKDKYKI